MTLHCLYSFPFSALPFTLPPVSYYTPIPGHHEPQLTLLTAFNKQVAHKQPYTLGQELTLASLFIPAMNYTGPVDVVAGQHDFPFCGGDCEYPSDQAAATIVEFYPAASSGSESFVVPNSGHSINAHYEAGTQFTQIRAFLSKNGL